MRRLALPFLSVVLAGCGAVPEGSRRQAVDEGYLLGEADAVKRLYWAKQALEAPSAERPAGKTEYYEWEESGPMRDGRKLAPETVAVPVFVPDPVPSGGRNP
jgi:hypothetical protein